MSEAHTPDNSTLREESARASSNDSAMTSHAVTNDMPDCAEDHSSELFTLVEQLEYVPAPKRKKKDDSFSEDLVPVPPIESVSHARAILEAMLFSTNDPLSVARLCKLMNNLHPRTVRGLVLELQLEYERRGGGLQIADVAGGYQMATRTPMADWVMQLHRQRRRNALSPATLETLAIIAYKQPVTRAEIEVVRGVESGATVRTLQDIGLVDVSGRRDVPGRPQLHVTTDSFLKIFGLRSLADLPSIAELKHLFAEKQPMPARISAADSPHEDQADTSVTAAEEPLPQ